MLNDTTRLHGKFCAQSQRTKTTFLSKACSKCTYHKLPQEAVDVDHLLEQRVLLARTLVAIAARTTTNGDATEAGHVTAVLLRRCVGRVRGRRRTAGVVVVKARARVDRPAREKCGIDRLSVHWTRGV